ncbi:hypothetical protein BZA03_101569 [Alteromonas sp. I10]|nr:hypothetical protein BZA03_101569 [Alteromonas sp. I10]CAI2389597.1 hypothetical protein ALT831_01549 [Alteromonas macleodii]CAI3947428.1 hypothetical protein ALTBGP9_01479 [Alteromonas macleodii]CAI3948288.1 hypothetical protein MIT1002_01536 [Alteromonas macleodii]CAI3948367.1 hypothetical protein EZ55_01560 [Alteromonas macleodii]
MAVVLISGDVKNKLCRILNPIRNNEEVFRG